MWETHPNDYRVFFKTILEIFDCRLGRKRLRPNMFPASTLHVMEANEKKQRLSGFHCFVFKFRLFQRVVDQLNLLKYCGIKVNGSKEKPSRFLQIQLISVWLIRYNYCKLIKLAFFVPFTKNGIFKLTKCGLSSKGLCILRSVTRIMVKTYNCSCNSNMYLWWCSNVYKRLQSFIWRYFYCALSSSPNCGFLLDWVVSFFQH